MYQIVLTKEQLCEAVATYLNEHVLKDEVNVTGVNRDTVTGHFTFDTAKVEE